MEAAKAVWNLVGQEHTENFVVIGGAALLFHGSNISTNDADLGITADSMNTFCELARRDTRFTEDLICPWRYESSYGFAVEIDFLDKLGDYMHGAKDYCLIQGVPVATLADLVLGKGDSWLDRGREKDLAGLMYVVEKMERAGEDFKGLGEEGRKLLGEIMEELEDSLEGRYVLAIVKKLL